MRLCVLRAHSDVYAQCRCWPGPYLSVCPDTTASLCMCVVAFSLPIIPIFPLALRLPTGPFWQWPAARVGGTLAKTSADL